MAGKERSDFTVGVAVLLGAASALFACAPRDAGEHHGATDGGARPVGTVAAASHGLPPVRTATANTASHAPAGAPVQAMSMMRILPIDKQHVGSFVWTDAQWHTRCRNVRTSYNPVSDLREDALTLRPQDPRWLDFVFWTLNNKVNEHQVEAYGGTGWKGPKGGVIFHFAPGSRWERDSLHSFGFTIGHVVGEHRWTDTMFPDFFEKYGGAYGVNVKDRLAEIAPRDSGPWVEFLEYQAGAGSPYARYLLHIDASVAVNERRVALAAGQGIAFNYSFERLYYELSMILTDCKAIDFFEMYDRFGPGFAAEGNWANQRMPPSALASVGYASHARYTPDLGLDGTMQSPALPFEESRPIEIPPDLPEAERMRRGEKVYAAQCVDCHGVAGDGAGYLAEGLDVKPRDFRQGKYKLRSTLVGELPAIADIERSVRDGVPATTMPAWGQFFNDEEIGDVARYLVSFSPRFVAAWREHQAPRSLAVPKPPTEVEEVAAHPTGSVRPCLAPNSASSLPCEGEQLWNLHQCGWCHGDDARGDGPTARGMTDAWGQSIRPANLTYKWLFKNGHRPEDVYRTMFGGLNGTPMGSYVSEIPNERDRWAIVAYVLSLSPATRPVIHLAGFAAARARRIGPDGLVLPAPP
jgi:mono/diheme cytochrome c family protein